MTQATETMTVNVGGYPATFTARKAGQFGCDPCICGHRPAAGEKVWVRQSYGDLRCQNYPNCLSTR